MLMLCEVSVGKNHRPRTFDLVSVDVMLMGKELAPVGAIQGVEAPSFSSAP